jgi:hypothetical protein
MGLCGREGFSNFQKIKQRGFPVHTIGNVIKESFFYIHFDRARPAD